MLKYLLYLAFINLFFSFGIHASELTINSNVLEVDRNNKISIFVGNVYAYNQDIKIWSEKISVKFKNNEKEIEELNAENKVKIINKGITATGEIAIYDPNKNILNMYGNVEVIENNNFVKCEELFLDLNNSTSIMKSSSFKRVEAIIINE